MDRITIRAELGVVRRMPGGRTRIEVEVPPGARVSDALARAGVPADAAPLILVNRTAATPETRLSPGDEITLLPLIVGG